MDKEARNERYLTLMDSLFERAGKTEIKLNSSLEYELKTVFSSSARGFREIVLVIVLSKLSDKNYDAYTNFYSCNPRAVYEGPIRTQLDKRNIPRGKSGPLNVAKAAKGIDEVWAAQRRPKGIADSVVTIVKNINKANPQELDQIALRIHQLLLGKAQEIEEYETDSSDESNPIKVVTMLRIMTESVPDRGNVPQKICGYILEAYSRQFNNTIQILGIEDEACTTNTTSKKPGDVVQIGEDEQILNIFEISVKVVDSNRLEDSWESIRDYNEKNSDKITEVIYLCRPEDAATILKHLGKDILLGVVPYKGLLIKFVNIFTWMELMVIVYLNKKGRAQLLKRFSDYVNNKDTPIKVKTAWKQLCN